MQALSQQLDDLKRENNLLRQKLADWYHRAGQTDLLAAHQQQSQQQQQQKEEEKEKEGGMEEQGDGGVKDAHLIAAEMLVKTAAAEKDKRARSDSITTGAELLGGFKKQRVESPQLSISTGVEGAGEGGQGQEGLEEGEGGKEGEGKEGGKKEIHTGIFGEGYETPRNTIKGNAIAL